MPTAPGPEAQASAAGETRPGSPDAILDRLEQFGIRLGLDTIRRVLEASGRPQDRFPSVLVGGTNGKGSTAALTASVAAAAGYRTGLYTSPHLERPEERVRIDGRAVAGEHLAAALVEAVSAAEAEVGHPPTYFEALTAAALRLFAESEVELAVLEVGMGGRLDATNAVEPVLSVIAEISADHREHLGHDLSAIAREKGGILRAGRPALAAPGAGAPVAAEALRDLAAEVDCRLELVAETCTVTAQPPAGGSRRVDLFTPRAVRVVRFGWEGEHQLGNLLLAVRAAELLAEGGFPRIDGEAIERGVARCRWPGRMERVALPDGERVVIDAAHNASGAASLVAALAASGERYDLLFGALADKEVEAMLPPLAEGARSVYLTEPSSGRACRLDRLRTLAGERLAAASPVPAEVLTEALERGGASLVVCGSLYLVGEVRGLLRDRYGVPAPASDPLWPVE